MARRSAGCRGSARASNSACGCRQFVAENPKARGVVLEAHGLFTWGATSKECYDTTLEVINRAIAWLGERNAGTPAFGGERVARAAAASAAARSPRR